MYNYLRVNLTDTKDILLIGLRTLMDVKPYEKITISDILNICNFSSRNTFYNIFSGKDALITYYFDCMIESCSLACKCDENDPVSVISECITEYIQIARLIIDDVSKISRYAFVLNLQNKLVNLIVKYIAENRISNESDESLLTSIISGTILDYVMLRHTSNNTISELEAWKNILVYCLES